MLTYDLRVERVKQCIVGGEPETTTVCMYTAKGEAAADDKGSTVRRKEIDTSHELKHELISRGDKLIPSSSPPIDLFHEDIEETTKRRGCFSGRRKRKAIIRIM